MVQQADGFHAPAWHSAGSSSLAGGIDTGRAVCMRMEHAPSDSPSDSGLDRPGELGLVEVELVLVRASRGRLATMAHCCTGMLY